MNVCVSQEKLNRVRMSFSFFSVKISVSMFNNLKMLPNTKGTL